MPVRNFRRPLFGAMQAVTLAVALLLLAGCGQQATGGARLVGDWDYYRMLGAAPNGGFEARRRFGFAHFDGPSTEGVWLRRRSSEPLESIKAVSLTGDSLVLSLGEDRTIRAIVSGDTITGRIYRGDQPITGSGSSGAPARPYGNQTIRSGPVLFPSRASRSRLIRPCR